MKSWMLALMLSVGMVVQVAHAQGMASTQNKTLQDVTAQAQQQGQSSGNVSAADIYVTCKDYFKHEFNSARRENVGRKANCVAYFFGVGSTLLMLQSEKVDTGICLPETLSTEELIRLFNNWMGEHPDQGQTIATEVVLKALTEIHPCKSIVPIKPQN